MTTGLLLFGAGFHGVNDGIHYADANCVATVVDEDFGKLVEMRNIYPGTWSWVAGDAWAYAALAYEHNIVYDAVSVDTWTGDMSEKASSLGNLLLWTALARRLVTVTVASNDDKIKPDLIEGWKASVMSRSPKANWIVLERI